jgi:hypothetical protein
MIGEYIAENRGLKQFIDIYGLNINEISSGVKKTESIFER